MTTTFVKYRGSLASLLTSLLLSPFYGSRYTGRFTLVCGCCYRDMVHIRELGRVQCKCTKIKSNTCQTDIYQCYIFKQKLQVSSSFKSWKISILCYKYKLLEVNQDRKGNRCEIEPCVESQVLLNIWKGTLKCLCTECYDGYHLIGKSHCFLECFSDATRQNQNYRLNNIN